MAKFQVTVSNIGTVYNGTSEHKAHKEYAEYCDASRLSWGLPSGEEVTLWENGEPIKEFNGYILGMYHEKPRPVEP